MYRRKRSGAIGDHGGVPTETGAGRLSEPGKSGVPDLSDKQEETQSTIYDAACLARR